MTTTKTTKTKTKPISRVQRIQIQLMRLSSFNEFNGDRVADSLIEHRDLWIGFILDRESYSAEYARRKFEEGGCEGLPFAPIDTIRLRDIASNYWNVDALFILPQPGKEDSLELLVRREWGADEINWYNPGDASHIWLNPPKKLGDKSDVVNIEKMLRVWWD